MKKFIFFVISILLFCCILVVSAEEITINTTGKPPINPTIKESKEPITYITIPNGGRMEFNTSPRWDGNQTIRIQHLFPEINVHTNLELALIPGHVYYIRVEDMGLPANAS